MQVTVEYPQIMKMTISSKLEIPDESTIQEVKEHVFADFWRIFNQMWPDRAGMHGSMEDITLKDGDEEITTDAMLKGKEKIQAIFIKHGM